MGAHPVMPPSESHAAPGPISAAYARAMVALRWWIIGFWVLATIGVLAALPSLTDAKGGDGLKGLLNIDTPAVTTELRSVEIFGFPLLARTVLVQRDAAGLSVYAQARSVTHAVAVNEKKYRNLGPILGALPLTNELSLFPAAHERNTTSLTYLFFDPRVSLSSQTRAARKYGDRFFEPRDHVVGVSGSVPARTAQGSIIEDHLPAVELATLMAIILITGVAFRSFIAPAVALAIIGVSYVLVLRLSGALAERFSFSTPSELLPVIVAMLLGVVTDYVVFFFSALRDELEQTADVQDAVRAATARFGPIVGVAGLAVAAGTASLFAAGSAFFRALGPALVFTVIVALIVSVTLVPAGMAVLGRWVFWPSRPRPAPATVGDPAPVGPSRRTISSVIAGSRRLAAIVVVSCTLGLALAALPLLRLGLGVSFVESLPDSNSVRAAAAAAQTGFAPGILSPTVVLVEGDKVTEKRGKLRKLGGLLKEAPGVAGVLGPGDQPLPREIGVLLARDKSAARYLVVLDEPPLGAAAVKDVDELQHSLPSLLDRAGLGDATAGLAGDTATGVFIVDQVQRDLVRIAIAAILANLLMLILFLRAVVAALYLLVASALSVSASLGLATLMFDWLDPGQGLTFYVPFAAAVLLLAFGSDYNIFGVGSVWEAARHRSLAEAIAAAMPGTTRAISAAGIALAASFGLLAIVPLTHFRQLAFVMLVGILLDVFVVRLLLMPALLTVVGPVSAWPSRRLSHKPRRHVLPRRTRLALGLPDDDRPDGQKDSRDRSPESPT